MGLGDITGNLNIPVLSALLLGLITVISPCPLATNIGAIAYVSRRVKERRYAVITGALYTLGRMFSYSIIGVLIIVRAAIWSIASSGRYTAFVSSAARSSTRRGSRLRKGRSPVQPPGVITARQVVDKTAFMVELDKHWSQWRMLEQGGPGSPQEALLQFELAGGWEQYVHVTGTLPDRETERKVIETLLDLPVICIKGIGSGYNYINPANIIRARMYHSNRESFRPIRVLPLDPQEM